VLKQLLSQLEKWFEGWSQRSELAEPRWYRGNEHCKIGPIDVTIVAGFDARQRRIARIAARTEHPGLRLTYARGERAWRSPDAGDDGVLLLPALRARLSSIPSAVDLEIVVADGEVAIGARGALLPSHVKRLVNTAGFLARWDAAVARVLLALPDAAPIEDAALVPAVALRPDHLVLGVRDGTLYLRHGDREEVVPGRDAATVQAAIAALRGQAGVYR
jgi:hypothetical protein